ncbi:hypothetical protein AB4343_16135 [Vibrio breoganii]|uniref:hypothetical protein n=1 Tax=Vibrio breoganii TaxID=553239 RepID=UPI000C831B71|nr:hypothetical protein [Vibrio breoganii]PMP10193.1 hypothetical protein BCS94_18250 [Vibrio breoganii]
MKYFVRQMILGPTAILPIEPERYYSLSKSRDALVAAKAIEEKYDLMIANYLEFEKELLVQVSNQMVLSKNSYDDFYEIKTILNRRIVNLLTSTKLYYDQMKRKVRQCDLKEENLEYAAIQCFSREYDSCFEYRFMENLRNYVQHCGLAIHSFSLPSFWEGEDGSQLMVNKLKIHSTKSELGQDPKFSKRPVFKECSDAIELVFAIRAYVECMSTVHSDIRDLIEPNVNRARADIEDILSDYKQVNSNDTVGTYAYGVASGNPWDKVESKLPLLLDWDNVRISLKAKNKKLTKLSKRYVSGNCL